VAFFQAYIYIDQRIKLLFNVFSILWHIKQLLDSKLKGNIFSTPIRLSFWAELRCLTVRSFVHATQKRFTFYSIQQKRNNVSCSKRSDKKEEFIFVTWFRNVRQYLNMCYTRYHEEIEPPKERIFFSTPQVTKRVVFLGVKYGLFL